MSKIVMASNNRHKIKEIETFLRKLCPNDRNGEPFEILSLSDIGYTADIVEDGETFEDNALIKARTVVISLKLLTPKILATLQYLRTQGGYSACERELVVMPLLYSISEGSNRAQLLPCGMCKCAPS